MSTLNFTDAQGNINFAAWAAADSAMADEFGRAHNPASFTDAQVGLAFLTPQLHRIETEVYQTKYPSFDYASLMTVNTDGDMWDVGTLVYSMDTVGQANFIAGKGSDMPYADFTKDQKTRAFHLAGIGYEWSIQELQRAAKLGRSLSADKAMSASKTAEAFLWNIALYGNTEKGYSGLVNNASVPTAAAATGGWATATVDQVIADANQALIDVNQNTRETHVANTLLIPTTARNQLAAKRLDDGSMSLLKYIVENNAYTAETGQPLTIKATRALETAGAGGTRRIMGYDNSREVVQFLLPGPHEFQTPFQKGSMVYEVAGIMNVGGTDFRLPKAASYRDGV